MNLYNFDTREKLDAYGQAILVVTENIQKSSVTGNDRAVALFHFNADFLSKTITLVVGVYELNSNGEPIISKSLNPYEEMIVATNGKEVDMNSETLEVVKPDDKEENGFYMGEFDAYIFLTKNKEIKLWDLFKSIIVRSSTINPPTI